MLYYAAFNSLNKIERGGETKMNQQMDYETLKRKYEALKERERYWKIKARPETTKQEFIKAVSNNDRLIAWTLVLGGSAAAMLSRLFDTQEDTGIVPETKPWMWAVSPSIAINQSIMDKLIDGDTGTSILTLASTGAAGFGAAYLLLSASSGENDDNPLGKALLAGLGA